MPLPGFAGAQPGLQLISLRQHRDGGLKRTRPTNGTTMEIKLTGRNALITGGSKGLGLAIARTFAEAGADVAIMARRQGPLDEAAAAIASRSGRKVLTIAGDVRRADEIEAG